MVDTFKQKIIRWAFHHDWISEKDLHHMGWIFADDVKKDHALEINRRVAEIVSQMDPLYPLLKQYSVIFSEEFERVEEPLDEPSRIGMAMWAYGQKRDPYMKRMIEWIMNSAGNETMKRAPITAERTQYGRGQIANMILFRKEIGRLSTIYEELLGRSKGDDFDENTVVE